jgi:hypothetical protein
MTRVVGRSIVQTPCCGRHYWKPLYGSMNFSAREHWSDGRNIESLAPQGEGLHLCACGTLFLGQQCTSVGTLPALRGIDTRPASEQALAPPKLVEPPDSDIEAIVASCPPQRELIVPARRRLWRIFNDPFRDVYRRHMAENKGSLPVFEPTPQQRENMQALVERLDGHEGAPYDEVTELYRELGDFERAARALEKVVPDMFGDSLAPMLRRLIRDRISAPVRYRW